MHHQYKEPPPYPGHLKHLATAGYRQSYSGSEASTDISLSSTENLSTRQDPQGEETTQLPPVPAYGSSSENYSILARLRGMPAPAVEVKSTNSGAFYVTSTGSGNMDEDTSQWTQPPQGYYQEQSQNLGQGQMQHLGQGQTQQIPVQWASNEAIHASKQPSPARNYDLSSAPARSRQQLGTYVNLTVPAHIAGGGLGDLPPPPQYPGYKGVHDDSRGLLAGEQKLQMTRSQPDLTHLHEGYNVREISLQTQGLPYSQYQEPPDHAAIAARASQMVGLLSEENKNLREELDNYYKKVSKLQKFEMEIQKVHEAYDLLIKSGQKRENLEKQMRKKLDLEIRKLKLENKELQRKVDSLEQSSCNPVLVSGMEQELMQKEDTIVKLVQQNKDLTTIKDRLEVELSAQSSTLQEQRKHIDVLDSALNNTQANIFKMEEECSKSQAYCGRVEQLQTTLSSIQLGNRKRQELENNLRGKLEKEIDTLKRKLEGMPLENKEVISSLTYEQSLIEKDKKILELESQVTQLEQKFLEETALHELAIDAASTPKDARIAALEMGSVESDKIIAEAKSERLHHLDEVYQANRKCTELEAKIRQMNAHLAEKDAMIRVLEKHTKSGSVSSLMISPRHSPHPSMSSSQPTSRQNSQLDTNAVGSTLVHNKSASSGGEVVTEKTKTKERRPSLQEKNIVVPTPISPKKEENRPQTEDVSQHLWEV